MGMPDFFPEPHGVGALDFLALSDALDVFFPNWFGFPYGKELPYSAIKA